MLRILSVCLLLGACAVEISHTPAEDHPTASAEAALATCPAPVLVPVTSAPSLAVSGDPGSAAGVFDASVVYPAGASGGAMAYSSVHDQHNIRTRVALSADRGRTWTFAAELNRPELAMIPSSDPAECATGWCVGWLISEVSSLIADPTDPDPSARWKLYAHRYLAEANHRLHYRLGTITVQTAPAPQGPWTAPRKLFGLTSPSPYTTTGIQVNANQLAGLGDCLALTEPSALWRPDRIDLAMGCVYLEASRGPMIRIVRVRSHDHGRTWIGLGTMLFPGDADCLPGATPRASVNAADLFLGSDGAEYVSATASDPGYHGCAFYKVADPATGQIERHPDGAPRVQLMIAPTTGQFGGACSTSSIGTLLSVGFFGSAVPFRMFHLP